MNTALLPAQRLLALPDQHRALLAEYDYFPACDLLHVQWHGHITATAVVQGAQAGLDLFRGRPLPRRVLSNHSHTSGDWGEAIVWLHYDWLPQALCRGVRLLAHVLPHELSTSLAREPGGPELIGALSKGLLMKSFRSQAAAWHWATTR